MVFLSKYLALFDFPTLRLLIARKTPSLGLTFPVKSGKACGEGIWVLTSKI
jgi:hypothetical protein